MAREVKGWDKRTISAVLGWRKGNAPALRREADAKALEGEELAAAGHHAEALLAYEAAIELYPKHYLAQFGRAKIMVERQHPDGLNALTAVSRAFPTKFIPYKRRFEALLGRGAYDDAAAVLAEAGTHLPDEPRVGDLLRRLSDRRGVQPGAAEHGAAHRPSHERRSDGFRRSFQTAPAFNDYLPTFRSGIDALEQQALRERSYRTRELLALTATEGLFGFATLVDVLRRMPSGRLAGSLTSALNLPGYRSKALVALARVVAAQEIAPTDLSDARMIYDFVKRTQPDAMRDIDWVQLLLLPAGDDLARAFGDLERSGLAARDPVDFALILANLMLRDKELAKQGDAALFALNTLYRQGGIEGVRIRDEARPLASLTTDPLDHIVPEGPLATIIMTTYEPGESLDLAMRSVLEQSWRNIELIVVDDASSSEAFRRVQDWAGRDRRVRVLRNDRNQGTYVSKNRGLAEARGVFVTCHDSDDWSHGRKIELQVESLIASDAVASVSRWARCAPDLQFQSFSGRGTLAYENPSSLLYRREAVLEKVGFYDSVRTGADSEFKARVEMVFRRDAASTGRNPLSFGQVHDASLTANNLGRGWFSPERLAYRGAWRRWHQRLRDEGVSPFVPREADRTRFAVPDALLPDGSTPGTGDAIPYYDAILIGDFRMAGSNTIAAVEEIKAQARAGLRTAVCQVGSFRKGVLAQEFIDPPMQDAISAGLADRIDIGDRVKAGLVTIRYPAIFQFAERSRTGIEAERVVVVVSQPPAERDTRDRRYDLPETVGNIQRIFGAPQTWAPIGPLVRGAMAAHIGDTSFARADWSNVIDIAEWPGPRQKVIGVEPVIGRHGRDDHTKWPATADEILAAYPSEAGIKVRILGGARSAGRVVGLVPARWEVLAFDAENPRDFLRSIDFFVYFHHPDRSEEFGRTIIEAAASGCVAILPPAFEPLMKDGAIYCAPDEVTQIVRRLHADPAAFRAQSRKGYDHVAHNFCYEMHVDRVASARRGDPL
jgi:tetratricopeptide (TPR) repeat protein